MRISTHAAHSNQIRQETYKIIKRMHRLEDGRRISQLVSAHCGNHTCACDCSRHVRLILALLLTQVTEPILAKRIERFLASLNKLSEMICHLTQEGRPLNKRIIGRILNNHTRLFKAISIQEIAIFIDIDINREWVDLANTCIASELIAIRVD